MRQQEKRDSLWLRVALFSLGLCVFGWGVQAKLSLYFVSPKKPVPVVAKLSTERFATQTKEAIKKTPTDLSRPEKLFVLSFLMVFPLVSLGLPELFRGYSRLVAPLRNAQRVVYLFYRPPPSLRLISLS